MILVGIDNTQEVMFFSKGIPIDSIKEQDGIYLYEVEEMPKHEHGKKLFFDPESMTFYNKEYTAREIREMNEAIARMNEKEEAKKKRADALVWLAENDWKVNKHILGEWSDTDERWIEYVESRAQKRAEIDEADKILNE